MRVIVNSMLGKFSRWLRILGIDAIFLEEAPDRKLIDAAKKEDRILLTADVALFRLALKRGVKAFLIEGKNEVERLANFSKEFGIKLNIDERHTRCPKCNSILRFVEKEEIKNKVPSTTFKCYEKFWLCPNCDQVYWPGPHHAGMTKVLEEARRILQSKQ